MAGVPFSIEKFNAREQLITSDLMRAELLRSRELQDVLGFGGRSLDVGIASVPTNSLQLLSTLGTPISVVDQSPTWTPAAGFTATIGAGQGYLYYPPLPGLTADDSAFLVARWAAGVVTFGSPSGNPRIDLVVATPALVDTDLQSRNVLVDPVARTIAAQNMNKTSNPLAALSVVAGTAAANPVPPAVPVGTIPLFMVWVPVGAANSSRIAPCRASWRRAGFPFSAMTGVMHGTGMKWDTTVDPTTTSAGVIMKGFHRVVIDGEVLEFVANLDSAVATCVLPDTANNPFGAAAPATWDKPYYFYLVGGRHAPAPAFNSADEAASNGSGLSPVTLVESLTPPNLSMRQATATLTVNGQTIPVAATLYVGLGFVVANSTRRAPCIMNERMTLFGSVTNTVNRLQITKAGGTPELVGTPTSKPSISTTARVTLLTTTSTTIGLFPDNGAGAPLFYNGVNADAGASVAVGPSPAAAVGEVDWPAGAAGAIWQAGGVATEVVQVFVHGYSHHVGRFGSNVNP